MKEITNIEEKKIILNSVYYNNYILDLETRDNKYFNQIMKRERLFKTEDGFIIRYSMEKPTIDTDLWFDDEQPIPKLTEELFIEYNMSNLHSIQEKNGLKTFIYNPYNCENPYNVVKASQFEYAIRYDDNTFKRHLTDEEEEFILKIDNEVKENYIKRLKNYYKRYNNKIYCRGYWVNR